MKNSKALLSLYMVLIIIMVSVAPTFANDTVAEGPAVISDDLASVMQQADDNEKIKVYLWYKDINQTEVDALTTKATGLTPEKCAVISEFPSAELLASLKEGKKEAQKQMDEYLSRTKHMRDTERQLTDDYSRKHLQISNQMYEQKSNEVVNALSVSENNIEFKSKLAPMIIAEMTKSEIESAANNNSIKEISLYYDLISEEPSTIATTAEEITDLAKASVNLEIVYSVYGLSGDGVDLGLIEKYIPGPLTSGTEDFGFDLSDITVIENTPGSISPGINEPGTNNEHLHPNNSFRVMSHEDYGIARNINKYATKTSYADIEAMINYSVNNENVIDLILYNNSLFVYNLIHNEPNPDSVGGINNSYAYVDLEKYIDHIVSFHNISIVVPAGNYGAKSTDSYDYNMNIWRPGARVTGPGLAYNVITVGAYDNNNETDGTNINDKLYAYSGWQNSFAHMYGCEKPDVIMPANFYIGGTSEAGPALAAQIALMLELKPSLALQPEAVKAIVLASCHRKVLPSIQGEATETMTAGITERQGAGVPDAWAMISIVCQGTYGVGELYGTSATINFVQPPYDATNMNVSLTWIKENEHVGIDDSYDFSGFFDNNYTISDAPAFDLNLQVVRGDGGATSNSTNLYSSTEMCYLGLSDTNYNYQINISNGSPVISKVRYGYAWSTDKMRAYEDADEGVYYIKNAYNGRYVTYEDSDTPKAQMRRVSAITAFNQNHQWVIKQNTTGFNILPGNAEDIIYLGQSSVQSGTSMVSQLDSLAEQINLVYNDDGTVSFVNSTNDRILSYSSSNLVWNTYNSTTQSPTNAQKWYLEKVNYLKGDVNADGEISKTIDGENQEAIALQRYMSYLEPFTNLNRFLADVDYDGVASLMDIAVILNIAESQYNYNPR